MVYMTDALRPFPQLVVLLCKAMQSVGDQAWLTVGDQEKPALEDDVYPSFQLLGAFWEEPLLDAHNVVNFFSCLCWVLPFQSLSLNKFFLPSVFFVTVTQK